jgi:hypothetical protein
MAYVVSPDSWSSLSNVVTYRKLADSPMDLNVTSDVFDVEISPVDFLLKDRKKKKSYLLDSPYLVSSPVVTVDSVTSPMVVTETIVDSITSPYLTSVVLDQPMGIYTNLNADPQVRSRMAKNLYYKLLDKWLYDDLSDALNYFKVKDGKVKPISSMKEYSSKTVEKDSIDTIEKKIDYIEANVFSSSDMRRLLTEYVTETGTNWYDLLKHTTYIKKITKNTLLKKIKKRM